MPLVLGQVRLVKVLLDPKLLEALDLFPRTLVITSVVTETRGVASDSVSIDLVILPT